MDPAVDRSQAVLANINRAVLRSLRMINDLLDFTRARIGPGLAVDIRRVDLHAVVASQVKELRLAYPGRALIHHMEGAGACAADADRMAQIVDNLVSNAMVYGMPDRDVTVTTTVGPQDCAVSVHNRGREIPGGAAAQTVPADGARNGRPFGSQHRTGPVHRGRDRACARWLDGRVIQRVQRHDVQIAVAGANAQLKFTAVQYPLGQAAKFIGYLRSTSATLSL